MSSVRVSAALRTALLLVLALVCAGLQLTPVGSATQLHRPCPQHVAPAAAFEFAYTGGGEADSSRGSVLHRDRRRPVTATAGLPGPPLVARAAPLADPPAGCPGGMDTRPRPFAAHDSSALQVFRC
ncbi:hypothetical protein [Streptomyces sp. NBC_01353]|uniref:hypothetical protein n=1 Tax=Streptomyces sp. NBC_01353 TaxID=2903835 RepID=UPI002E302135|nr:hypothetical protein [Streptomyces sp. NBC_01353]